MVTFLMLPWWTVPLSSSVLRMKSTNYCPTSTLQKQMGLTFQLECLKRLPWASLPSWHIYSMYPSPIPKSGDHSDPRNYRSISLLSLLSKLLEKHIQHLLATHLEENHPISAQQWGFTHGKSTTGALLDVTDHWHKELEQSHDIWSVFFDYSKAFNSVPHIPLLHKLQQCGVHPQILRWLANYLTMRKQYVCVSGATLDTLPVSSGVPQGSVLGPMLFNIYISDITAVALSDRSMTLFADDMMLYRSIYTAADFHLLQTDVDKLCNWTDNNLLKFNSRKCKYMIISRKIRPTLPGALLTVNGSPLEKVKSYKYLGVWLLHWVGLCKCQLCARKRDRNSG